MRERSRSLTTGSRMEGAAHGPLDALAIHGASAAVRKERPFFCSGKRWDGGVWVDGSGGPAFPHCRWRMSIFGVIILKTMSLSVAFSLLSFVVYMEEGRGKGREGWLRRRRCLLRERGSGRVRGIHVAGGTVTCGDRHFGSRVWLWTARRSRVALSLGLFLCLF